MSVVRLDGPCGEADLAVLLASSGLTEARRIRADLLRQSLDELAAEPGEERVAVDDKPNPFGSPVMADAYLRDARPPRPAGPLASPDPGRWRQHAAYSAARAFRVVSELGVRVRPALAVLGCGDGLGLGERAQTIDACLRRRRPFAVVHPIDEMARFLAVDSEDRQASVAIVAFSFQHVAVAVATGSAVAVGTHHTALIRRGGGPWLAACDLPANPPAFPAPPGADVIAVRLDGRPATLVVAAPKGGIRVARVYACGGGHEAAATTRIPAR